MRTRRLTRYPLAAVLFLSFTATAFAQSNDASKLIVPMKAGYYVSFSTMPEAKAVDKSSWSTSFAEAYFATNTLRRVFVDNAGALYFGYALVVEPVASSNQFKVSVRPLGPEDEQELRARKSFQSRRLHPNYNAAGLARSSSPQLVRDGDTFALDVLVNPQTGDKITDIVTISASMERLEEAPVSESPRDFTLEDVELKMINYRLLINGELVAGGKQSGACAGPVIWFHLPEKRGRFIFSLMPHAGYDFQQIGTIERNRIKFTLGGESYEWISDTPVVSVAGTWNLYVLYDQSYIPDPFLLGVEGAAKTEQSASSRMNQIIAKYPAQKRAPSGFGSPPGAHKEDQSDKSPAAARLVIGAADRVENLLPKK